MSKPLVFIHGSGDSARIWRPQLSYFGSQRAYAIDLPGHGQRPDTLPAETSIHAYAEAAHMIFTQELQLTRPIIAGHSLGGAVALMLALEYGNELDGLILIGTGARLRVHPQLLENARQAQRQARQNLAELAVASSNITQISAIEEDQPEPGPNILYRDLSACNVFDIMDRLQEIQLPTLIIVGEEDRLTPPKYSQYLQQHIQNATLRVVPQAGHYVMREQAEQVNQAIDAWCADHA